MRQNGIKLINHKPRSMRGNLNLRNRGPKSGLLQGIYTQVKYQSGSLARVIVNGRVNERRVEKNGVQIDIVVPSKK